MKLVIAATPNVALPTIKALQKIHEVVVVTQPDAPAGRGKQMRESEVAIAFPNSLKPQNESELSAILKDSDLLITIGYGRLLSLETLTIPKFGGVNLHFSLLPKWRGAAPVQRAIEAGDKVTGVTVFQMDKGMDTGPIWEQLEHPIAYGTDSISLFAELAEIGVVAVEKTLSKIESDAHAIPQTGVASIAKKIEKSECVIDWSKDAESILRKIKAFAFNPGVTTTIRGAQLKINDARISDTALQSGEINQKGEVGTGIGSITLLEVTPAGKKRMSTKDWLNGFKVIVGERFE